MSALIERIAVTIASGASSSGAAILAGKRPSLIQMPDAWTAAPISFLGSPDGTNFYSLYDTAGVVISALASPGWRIALSPTYFSNMISLKVLSGVPGTLVNQGADRILYVEFWS
jgi:hypothetical protein